MLQPKDRDWLNGFKNKTRIYAVCKRPTSDLGTHTDWKWGYGKRYSMQVILNWGVLGSTLPQGCTPNCCVARSSSSLGTLIPCIRCEVSSHSPLQANETKLSPKEEPCGWQVLGAPAGCHTCASEVGELISGYWSTRDLLAPCNIKQRKLSQRCPSQC